MEHLSSQSRRVVASVFLFVISLSTHASVTIDLTGEGNQGDPGWGNTLNFAGIDGSTTVNLDVSAYGETGSETPAGSSFYLFEEAEAYSWGTGIGSCNQEEGVVGGSWPNNCNSTEHEVDTIGRDDLIVFYFDQLVNFENLTVDPYQSGNDANDRDIIYWVGTVASLPDITLETFNTLDTITGVGPETLVQASDSYAPHTHQLTGTGNILLFSGDYHNLACKSHNVGDPGWYDECEAYKISNITVSTVIPVPASLWLFASAALGLIVTRRARI